MHGYVVIVVVVVVVIIVQLTGPVTSLSHCDPATDSRRRLRLGTNVKSDEHHRQHSKCLDSDADRMERCVTEQDGLIIALQVSK